MIQIYEKNNENYSANGQVITPLKCELSIELNGTWQLEIECDFNSADAEAIKNDNVVAIDTPIAEKQLYRIKKIEKDDLDMTITAVAVPIFLDSTGDVFILDKRPTNKTGQQALNELFSGTKYKGHSDIEKIKTAYYINKNVMEALASDDENSFLNVWGGEITYNNFDVYINGRAGGDYGVKAEFGHNLMGLTASEDFTDLVTRIVPKAYNGYMLDGTSPWVDSPLINNYATTHTKVIEYADIKLKEDASDGEENVTVCNTLADLRTELRKRAAEEFSSGIDKPKVNYDCDIIELSKYEEYKDFKELERVWLGDSVHCTNNNIGINVEARVIKLTYDCINEEVTNIELGNYTDNFLKEISSMTTAVNKALNDAGYIKADRILGIIDASQAKLKAQRKIAQKQDVRAILFEDLEPSSPTYGAMALGTAGFEIADKRTADGRDWQWSTFGTAKGFKADLIVAGTLAAIDISGVNITGSQIKGNAISGGTINGTTITGTTIKGNTISGGSIDGTTIKGGTIEGTVIKNKNKSDASEYIEIRYGDAYIQGNAGTTTIQGGNITISEKGASTDFVRVYPNRIKVVKNGRTIFDTDKL